MPIEFYCPSCRTLLKTPDNTAGRTAKCPKCQTLVTIPTPPPPESPFPGAGAPQIPPGDFGGFPELGPGGLPPLPSGGAFGSAPPPPQQSSNPYASPTSGGETGYGAPPTKTGRSGPPWEKEGASFGSYFRTWTLVLTSPVEMFTTMRRTGGTGMPLLYGIIAVSIGAIVANLFQQLLTGGFNQAARQGGPAAGGFIGGYVCGLVLCTPVGAMVGMYVNAGITHLFLMMCGGAKHNFETTFRVCSYVAGTLGYLNMIPIVGGLLYVIPNVVYTIIGLKHAHKTTTGKAAAAVLLPIGLCFCLVAVFVTLMFGAIMAAIQGANAN